MPSEYVPVVKEQTGKIIKFARQALIQCTEDRKIIQEVFEKLKSIAYNESPEIDPQEKQQARSLLIQCGKLLIDNKNAYAKCLDVYIKVQRDLVKTKGKEEGIPSYDDLTDDIARIDG